MADAFGDEIGPIEDVVEPLRAYRWFRVIARWDVERLGWIATPRLSSIHSDQVWPTSAEGGLEAECLSHGITTSDFVGGWKPGRPPCRNGERLHRFGHGCGIYGMSTLHDALVNDWGGHVLAEVLLGGRFITHKKGYRAQYATVSAIYNDSRPLRRVTTLYGVKYPALMASPDLGAIAKLYGVPLREIPADAQAEADATRARLAEEERRRLAKATPVAALPVQDAHIIKGDN